jgi:hypothetical protein
MPEHFRYIGIPQALGMELAIALADSIRERISNAIDVNDEPARPLAKKYGRLKSRRGLNPMRDWTLTGRTMAALQPMFRDGQIIVGFNDPRAAQIAAINNFQDRMFGVSRGDRARVVERLMARRREIVAKAA